MTAPTDIPPPFDRLAPADQQMLKLERGEALFRQGDASRAIFFLHEGAIDMIRHTEEGQKVTLFRARAGDTLAEPALFSDAYHCDTVATGPARVSRFDRSAVLELIRADSGFALALIARLAGQVQGYRRRLELMAIRSAPDRVFAGLADGRLTGSVVDFAAELGLTHETVYRALSDLVKSGRLEHPARGLYRVAGEAGAEG